MPLPAQVHDSTINLVGGDQHNTNQTIINNVYPQGEHPPHAIFAPFNCKNRTRCLEGTRAEILDQIFRWIGIRNSQPDSDPVLNRDAIGVDTCVFWINGPAGTGKTTIAYTVAEECSAHGVLGASFFCSRDDAECSNPNLIFTSIAYQLGNFNPSFGSEVARVMKSNPGIGYTTPPYQLQELIIKPLRIAGNSISPCVVVLDALDECKEAAMTSVILSSLSRHVNELFPLRFLVTSRPETHITTVFQSSELNPVTQRCVLHEVELAVVETDIKHYLLTELASTREAYHLEIEWPAAEDIHSLTRMSFGLFIFASTSVRFIQDRNYCDPEGQLGRLLCNAPTATEDSSPLYNLDRLYDQVLNNAFPNISLTLSDRLKKILGSIVLLRDPLSPVALARLLDVPLRTVGVTLHHLHSVIIVPDDDSQVIRTIHPSFFDFITNSARCQNPKFIVDSGSQHTLLARACLDVMKQLKRDICGIRNPSLLNSEVDDLPMRVKTCIRPELQYACRHWAWHLSNAMLDNLVDRLNEFCSKYLLYWVEALSLMGDLRIGLLVLDAAQQVIAKAGIDVTNTMNLLRDCGRFTLEFFSIISTCSLQVYHSALLFTPEDALIKKTYRRELDIPIKVYNGLDERWNSCIRTIEGHFGLVLSVAFSPDGARIVSGSTDKTIRLWDAVSGAHLNTFMGHFDSVRSVVFSPDGTRIVSGSEDNTIRLWDAANGAHLHTFMGHSNWVRSVVFSPDGTHIVSGSWDNTIRLWDVVSGAHLHTFIGHSCLVFSVAFSPDGTRIVSGSKDTTVVLWDAVSGAHLNTFMGHSDSVYSVAFSPNGTRIISGSDDETIRLWDAVSGAHLHTFEGHSRRVYSVAFSPDGARIISGSQDRTVRWWDAVSGAHLNTFKGHSSWVYSVAFSPDGTRIVSGSNDKTLRLWDAVSGTHLSTFMEHSDTVYSVAFSPDGTRIVSVSLYQTVQLWDAVSGAHLNNFLGHPYWVYSVAFSPDGTRIISRSFDNTVEMWDAVSCAHLNTFKGHSSSVESVAFSPDCMRIVSGSQDGAVRSWDAASGIHLNAFMGHSDTVYSVVFSPDGTRIVSGSWDSTIRLWDAVSGAHLHTFEGHSGRVYSVAFSPDGTRIISGSWDNTVRLWDAASGAHLNTLVGHSSLVKSVAFSTDGTRIVSGSHNNTVRLWDAASGAHLNNFEASFINVESIARSYHLSGNSLSTNPLNPTRQIFGYIARDGWVHSLTLNRRICWIPVPYRSERLAANGARAVFGRDDGRVIIFDFTGIEAYFRNL